MFSVIALVTIICVLAHQAQSRMLEPPGGLKLQPQEDPRDFRAFLDFKRMIDQAGSVMIGEKKSPRQTAELLRHWEDENRKECHIVVTKKLRGKCTKNNEGVSLCVSGKHVEPHAAECTPETEDDP